MTWNHTDVLLSVINLNGWILGFCSRVARLKGTFVLSYVQNWLLFRGDGVASVWTPNPGSLEFLSWNVHWRSAPVTYLTGHTQFSCNSHIGQSFSFYRGVCIFTTYKVVVFYQPIPASILGRGRRPCLTGSINVLVLQCKGQESECVALDLQDSRVGQPPPIFIAQKPPFAATPMYPNAPRAGIILLAPYHQQTVVSIKPFCLLLCNSGHAWSISTFHRWFWKKKYCGQVTVSRASFPAYCCSSNTHLHSVMFLAFISSQNVQNVFRENSQGAVPIALIVLQSWREA